METKDLDNLSGDELFEELKKKCKSNAKRDIYGGLLVLFLILILFFLKGEILDETKSILFLIIWIILGCLSGCAVLYNYLLLKKIDNLDTPEQLLYHFEKKHRYNIIFWAVAWILLISDIIVRGFDSWALTLSILTIWIVATVVILFCFYNNLGWYGKEKEILEQLRELVEKK